MRATRAARSANGSTVHRRLRPLAPRRRDMRAGVRAPSLICLAASQARAAATRRCGTRAQEGTWQLGGLSSSTISRPSLPRRTLIFARASAHTAHPEVNHCACPCGAVFALFFRSFFKEPLFRKRGNTRVFIEDFVFQRLLSSRGPSGAEKKRCVCVCQAARPRHVPSPGAPSQLLVCAARTPRGRARAC